MLVLYPLGILTPHLIFIGNMLGLFRKAGIPQFNLNYLQSIVFFEEFSNITYLISIIMTREGLLIMSPLLISSVLVLALEFKKQLDSNPTTPILSLEMVKSWVLKGAQHHV